jgi:hypothetical protein
MFEFEGRASRRRDCSMHLILPELCNAISVVETIIVELHRRHEVPMPAPLTFRQKAADAVALTIDCPVFSIKIG